VQSFALLLAVVLAVCGCASVGPTTPADQRATVPAALAVERQWLQSWFQGTPVLIGQRDDGAVSVEVHKHLLSRAVPASRLGRPTATATAAVQWRIEAAPP
jgi:hypothetical protein